MTIDLATLLANEQLMNTRLINAQSILRTMLDYRSISYTQDESIASLIRKLPVPTTIEWNCYTTWLTKSGPQNYRNGSARCYPVVRDQYGKSMANTPITVKKKAIAGGSWEDYGTYASSNDVYIYPDSNMGGYTYEVYVTSNSSISAQVTLPQYWYNYLIYDYNYFMGDILDTGNLIISNNVKSIDTSYLYDTNYFYVTAESAGELLLAIPLKNPPTIVGADSNTNIYISYMVTRGNTLSSENKFGVGGGMVGNGSRNSIGVFLDSADVDFADTYDNSFYFTSNEGYTETDVANECIVNISGGDSGAYTWFKNADNSISNYGPYWYASMLGSTYAPCLVVYKENATADERLKVMMKSIIATSP